MLTFLTFISRINTTSDSLKGRKVFIFQHFSFNEQLKFHSLSLSMKKVLQPQVLVKIKESSALDIYSFSSKNSEMSHLANWMMDHYAWTFKDWL